MKTPNDFTPQEEAYAIFLRYGPVVGAHTVLSLIGEVASREDIDRYQTIAAQFADLLAQSDDYKRSHIDWRVWKTTGGDMQESPSGIIDPTQTWEAAIAVLCGGGRENPRDIAAATIAHAIAAVLNRRGIEYTWYDVYDWVWEGDWWGDRAASYNPEDLATEWEAHPE